jgi:hypothetical protein
VSEWTETNGRNTTKQKTATDPAVAAIRVTTVAHFIARDFPLVGALERGA